MTEAVAAQAAAPGTGTSVEAPNIAQRAAEAPPGGPAAAQPATPPAQQPGIRNIGVDPNAPKSDTSQSNGPITYEPTGYTGLDVALEFLGKHGIDLDHPGMLAAEKGDFSILEAHFAQNPAEGWETMLRIGKDGYDRALKEIGERGAKVLADNQSVGAALFGSVEATEAALQYVSGVADASEQATLQEMLSAGGLKAQMALLFVADQYNAATGVTRTPTEDVTQRTASTATASHEKISRQQFAQECAKMRRQYGEGFESLPQYRALAARVR